MMLASTHGGYPNLTLRTTARHYLHSPALAFFLGEVSSSSSFASDRDFWRSFKRASISIGLLSLGTSSAFFLFGAGSSSSSSLSSSSSSLSAFEAPDCLLPATLALPFAFALARPRFPAFRL